MPTYQYACTNDECGLRFERVQAFTDDAITSCPDCSDRVRKVYGSVGVVFKGSGFYRNDSRQGASKSSDSGSSSSDSSDKSSSKPAEKASSDSSSSSTSSSSAAPAKSTSSETKSSAPVAS